MNPTDWTAYIGDWDHSVDYLVELGVPLTEAQITELRIRDNDWELLIRAAGFTPPKPMPVVPAYSKSKGDTIIHKYLRKGISSNKAQFFISEDGIAGNYGFWIPKSLLVKDHGDGIEVPNWFKINVTEFYE